MYNLKQTMRWYGSEDPLSLTQIRQAGCSGVVSALHHIPTGEVWPRQEILKRKKQIEEAGLTWDVVENLAVHESIKTQTGDFERHIENFKRTLHHLSACGIHIVTYNFMPLLDSTRTDLAYILNDGSQTLKYEKMALVAFDLFILKRSQAEKDYKRDEIQKAEQRFALMSEEDKSQLQKNILAGLSLDELREGAEMYRRINVHRYRQYLYFFLQEIMPVADQYNVKLALHPDDPPHTIFGLPRIASTTADLELIFEGITSLNNGLCFCTGSLGVRKLNNLPLMVRQFARRIHYLHMSNIHRSNRDFWEENHLDGSLDIYEVMKEVIQMMQKRDISIPMRPDHGFPMVLAELRGLEMGIQRTLMDSM